MMRPNAKDLKQHLRTRTRGPSDNLPQAQVKVFVLGGSIELPRFLRRDERQGDTKEVSPNTAFRHYMYARRQDVRLSTLSNVR